MPGPRADRNSPITVGTVTVEPGRRRSLELPIARLSTGTWLNLPVEVTNGRYQGPRIWVSGAVHGDELNGVEIVRQLVRKVQPRSLAGTLIAVPIVNVFGFVNESRYLPDRRDLNRSFPGSPRGSLAARLAHLFLRTVVAHCDVGIDLHTAAGERVNVPQVRGEFDDPETRRLAEAFGAPFLIEARLRDGSLRQAATQMGKRVLVYEAGQVRRFEEHCIEVGTSGVLRTMEALGMGDWDVPAPKDRPVRVRRTTWVRARRSGIALLDVELGEKVEQRAGHGDDRRCPAKPPVAGHRTGHRVGDCRPTRPFGQPGRRTRPRGPGRRCGQGAGRSWSRVAFTGTERAGDRPALINGGSWSA